ncbi:hypothetical protein MTO96_018718 [Rhipicephalus appendiculatus]
MSTRLTRRSTPANPDRRPPQHCKPGQYRSEHDDSQPNTTSGAGTNIALLPSSRRHVRRRRRRRSDRRALTTHALRGGLNIGGNDKRASPNTDAEIPATPTADDEETSPPEGSTCASPYPQDWDTAPAAPSPVKPTPTQENSAPHRLDDTATPEEYPSCPTARSTSGDSVGSSIQDAPPDDDEGNAPDQQSETQGEITLSGPIDDSNVLAEQTLQIRQLLREPATEERWDEFLSILEDAITAVRKEAKIPEAAAAGKPRRQTNPNNAQQIQGLYRRNRRRAVRVIVQGESKLCELPLDKLEEHFAATWAPKMADTRLLLNKARPDGMAEISLARFTSDEPLTCVSVSGECPPAWKESRTILIHKKGDPSEVTNWRPIALGSTISKLYAGCLAARMQQWVCDHDVLSRCQKGFLPHDGVFEHNFVLQERLDAARAGGGDLCVAFLDFANAFGSVPHNALIDSLRGAGAGEDFCAIVADLYRDNALPDCRRSRNNCACSHLGRNPTGLPTERPALQPGPRPRHPSGSGRKLQDRINVVATLAGQLGLRLNPKKCRSLHLSGRTPLGTRATKFFIDGEEIPRIGDYESQAFLGRPVGFSLLPDHTTVDEAISVGRTLLQSMLAPWQRIDALKTFVFPALNFAMRCGQIGKMEWARLDDALRPLIKKTLYLPGNAANSYLYGSAAAGAAGIPLAAETSDACRVDNAFKLLTSADLEVRELALDALTKIVSKRIHRPADPEELAGYLSGEMDGVFQARATQLQSVWTEARKASRRLNVTWMLYEDGGASITCGEDTLTPKNRRKVIRKLRYGLMRARDRSLHEKPNQGKAMECVAADPSSSHFMRSGKFTRFCDWRFIHRARLNLLPVNGAQPWTTNTDKRCRVCGYAVESLPHVLGHCMRHSVAYTGRHNRIVERVKQAASKKFTVTHENRPVGDTNLRPDLVLARGEEAIIVDVTCPFENRPEALEAARAEKERKYQPVRDYLLRRFQRVSIEAIVVRYARLLGPGK